ncbi:hypothetical protein HMPREF1017_00001, partial [Bacteroides ovatus 3_8_47FAA]
MGEQWFPYGENVVSLRGNYSLSPGNCTVLDL